VAASRVSVWAIDSAGDSDGFDRFAATDLHGLN
jgi:hypothetical protein